MKRVAILGCGPAGLLAAHASMLKGIQPTIFSKKTPSFIHGAQYLHRPIPLLTRLRPDASVVYVKMGDEAGYARKVYGNPRAETSWPRFNGRFDIWGMQETYDRLCEYYTEQVVDCDMRDPDVLRDILWETRFDLVVNTVPLKVLCVNPAHKFESQPVWIVRTAGTEIPPNTIMYDGSDSRRWYRASDIFGHRSTEFPEFVDGGVKVVKPLRTDCDCWPVVKRIGRYGAWRKKDLVHDAFEFVLKELA